MIVEILAFAGCPNSDPTRGTVEEILREFELEVEIRTIDVPDPEAAHRLRFLGSPTVRVDGRDVEPGSHERSDYGMGCRVFRTEAGLRGQPDERWIRAAVLEGVGE